RRGAARRYRTRHSGTSPPARAAGAGPAPRRRRNSRPRRSCGGTAPAPARAGPRWRRRSPWAPPPATRRGRNRRPTAPRGPPPAGGAPRPWQIRARSWWTLLPPEASGRPVRRPLSLRLAVRLGGRPLTLDPEQQVVPPVAPLVPVDPVRQALQSRGLL